MSFETTKQYLARVLPWPQAGEQGFINIHWMVPARERPGEKVFLGDPVTSIDDAIKVISKHLNQDVFVCLSMQRDTKVIKNRVVADRKAEKAVALKSLWLDIDCGDDKPYASPEAAGAALITFLDQAQIPWPTITVRSGGGLHVYWTFDRALIPQEWYPLACALVEAAKRHGLHADTKVTTDAARVLRPPETFNHKTSERRPVLMTVVRESDYSVEELDRALEPFKVEGASFVTHAAALPPEFANGLSSVFSRGIGDGDLSSGVHSNADEVRQMLDAIPNDKSDWNFWNDVAMRVYAATNGADYGLVEWKRWSEKNTSIADPKFTCEDRWNTLHGSGPERYNTMSLRKLARERLNDPSWNPQPSVQLAQMVQSGAVTSGVTTAPPNGFGATAGNLIPANDLPQGYSRDGRGWVFVAITNKEGVTKQVPVCQYPIFDGRVEKPWTLHFKAGVGENFALEPVSINCGTIGGPMMRQVLGEQGVLYKDQKLMGDFLLAWKDKLATTKVTQSVPFGWFNKEGKPQGFVYGGKMFTPNGDLPAQCADHTTFNTFSPQGSPDAWEHCSKIMAKEDRPEMDTILAAAFASPLVRFTGHNGLMLSVYSLDSGVGKTTTMEIAQAVWGHSVKGKSTLEDTPLSVANKAGKLQSLPILWDEVKGAEQARKLVGLTFQISMGKEKARLKADISQRDVGDWQLMLVTASNESLLDHIAEHTSGTTAGIYRCFQFEIQREEFKHKGGISREVGELKYNYGHAGMKYAEFLGKNYDRVDAEMGTMIKTLEKKLKSKADERFWVATVACLLLGAMYANELKLTQIDEKKFSKFLLKKFDDMRAQKKDLRVDMRDQDNIGELLTQFLKQMQGRNTLYTNKIHTGPGKPSGIKALTDISRIENVQVHYGVDDHKLRISVAALRKWLQADKRQSSSFKQVMEQEFGAKIIDGYLGSGTPVAGIKAKERIYHLDVGPGSKLAPLFEGM